MKALKNGYIFFIAFALAFNMCKSPENDQDKLLKNVVVFKGDLNAMSGPLLELEQLKLFPKHLYKVYQVAGIGFFYLDDPTDIIKSELREGRIWEPNIVDLLRQYVKPGMTAIDIGAHVGTHTVSMSKFAGDNGRVIAFEPQRKLFSELVMNLDLNKCRNVTAYCCALGDCVLGDGFKSIELVHSNGDIQGGIGVGSRGDLAEMITLDSLNLENVSFIRIDVENFEYEVLIGAEKTIRKNRPCMIIEIMGDTYVPIPDREARMRKTLKFVEEMKYSLKYIDGSWSEWFATPLAENEIGV